MAERRHTSVGRPHKRTYTSRPSLVNVRSTCLHFSFLLSSTDRPHTSFWRFARRRTNGILLNVVAAARGPHTTATSYSATTTTAADVADSKSRYLLLPRLVARRTMPVGAARPSARSFDDRSPGNMTQCACASRRETQSDVTSFEVACTERENARLFEETSSLIPVPANASVCLLVRCQTMNLY